jgi:crotonobetaine/carnitine-CoA ligase
MVEERRAKEKSFYAEFLPEFCPKDWTLGRILELQVDRNGDRPFLSWTDAGAPMSYRQVNLLVNRLAYGFRRSGVSKGDRVAIFGPNSLEYVYSYLALAKLGAVEVAIGEGSKGAFLEHQIRLTAPKIMITTPALLDRLRGSEGGLQTIQTVFLWTSENGSAQGKSTDCLEIDFSTLYDPETSNPVETVLPTDTAAILFTSGTTGPSKGAQLPHSQVCFFAAQNAALTGLGVEDVFLTGFPLSHANAQVLTVNSSLIAGAHAVIYERFSASDYIGRVRRSGATVVNLLGATMAFICAQPKTEDDRRHRLRCVHATPLSPELAKAFTERFGEVEFVSAFGQTEISMPLMSPPDEPIPTGACGKLLNDWYEVRLVDRETSEEISEGGVGELLLRPKQPGIITSGYFGMPEKTVEAWRDLWFHTGDAFRRDAEGWYYFVDRVKDALRRRGENISSFEVESVVRSHPAVMECAVVAVKADDDGGEDEVKACVVLKTGESLSFDEMIAWCDLRMPSHMVPRYLEVLAELPRTPSEKVRKTELRDAGVTPGTWDRVKAGVRLEHERGR